MAKETEKTLDDFTATMIAEGVEEASEEKQLAAWQHLVDTGLAWKLQGAFGRQATRLLEQGLIKWPEKDRKAMKRMVAERQAASKSLLGRGLIKWPGGRK